MCGVFGFVAVSCRAARTVFSRRYRLLWHQRINKGCNKSKKTSLSTSPFLSLGHQKHCNMTPVTFISGKTSDSKTRQKHQNQLKVIEQSLTTSQTMCPAHDMLFRVSMDSSKSVALAEYRDGAKKYFKNVLNLMDTQCLQILDPVANIGPMLLRLVFMHMPFPSWQQVLPQPDRMFLDVEGIP